jgi:putative transposase
MHSISRDHPCFYLTSVARDRLSAFRTDEIKLITCKALDEARKSGGFSLYAYVLMLDHLHVITDSARSSSDTLRFINGIISRRIIDYLKEGGYQSSLLKLRQQSKAQNYRYSLWNHHPNIRLLMTESMLMEHVNYTHQNRVRPGLAEQAEKNMVGRV